MNTLNQPDRTTPGQQPVPTWFLAIVTLPILLGLVWFGRDFLIPITLATFLFILNTALIEHVDSASIGGYSVPRWLAYIGVTAVVFTILIGLGYLVSNQAAAIGEAAPRYAERLNSLEASVDAFLGDEITQNIEQAIEQADIRTWLLNFASSAGGLLGNIGLILMYFAFMLVERGAFAKKLPRLFASQQDAKRSSEILHSISLGVRQYMLINTVTSAMSGTLAFVVLMFLDVDFAVTLALFVFLVNFIPTIGSFLAVVVPTLVALLQFDTIIPALIVVVVYGGGDAIIGNIVQPRLQGKSLNLSSFVVIVALAFWGMMWGGVGAFMAVPLTVVIMIVCSQVPGLRPVAIMLSTDGILPGENEKAVTKTD